MPSLQRIAKGLASLLSVQGPVSPPAFIGVSSKSLEGRWRDHFIKLDSSLVSRLEDWLSQYPPSEHDLYFCPTPLRSRRRRKGQVIGSRVVWADLDTIDPATLTHSPTIAWNSSPGRWQALWKLDKFLPPNEIEDLCKRMTYSIGADKGGWDLTQVLRIPNTINHKYPIRITSGMMIGGEM